MKLVHLVGFIVKKFILLFRYFLYTMLILKNTHKRAGVRVHTIFIPFTEIGLVPWQSSFVIMFVPACYGHVVPYFLEIDIKKYNISSLKLQGVIWSSDKYKEWNILWQTKFFMSRKWRKPPFLKTFVKNF